MSTVITTHANGDVEVTHHTQPKGVMQYTRQIVKYPQAHVVLTSGEPLPGMPVEIVAERFGNPPHDDRPGYVGPDGRTMQDPMLTIGSMSTNTVIELADMVCSTAVGEHFIEVLQSVFIERANAILSEDPGSTLRVEMFDTEIAEAPSVYTYQRWEQFVGIHGWTMFEKGEHLILLEDLTDDVAAEGLRRAAKQIVTALATHYNDLLAQES